MSDWPSRLARGRLTQAPLLRFVRRLGNIVDEAGMPQALHCRTGLEWHSDGSRALTMLSCAEAPSAGGETLFASSSQLFDALPREEQALAARALAVCEHRAHALPARSVYPA